MLNGEILLQTQVFRKITNQMKLKILKKLF